MHAYLLHLPIYCRIPLDQDISGNQEMRCENCPTKGCYNCPMFGVGNNPEYAKRKVG